MSTRTYPAFCSLNQPESQWLSMPVQEPVDQAMNLYPIFDEISWHESLLVTFQLFGQFLSGSAATTPYHSITASSPAHYPSVTQHNTSPGESSTPSPTRKTFSPVSREPSTSSRETVSPEGSYAPPHELTGPVRSKRAQHRVVHACDECRNKKKKCSGEQPLCLSCNNAGRYGVAKLCRPQFYTRERKSMTRQLHMGDIAAPKPTYPIKLQDMQGAATSASAIQKPQTASSSLGVGFPVQIASRRTRAVDFDWSDLGPSDSNQEYIPLPLTRPPYCGDVSSRVHPLHTRQRLLHEDIYRRAFAGQ
ncbi:hypothetical protein P692DRAFT_20863917 [Suillus brevipes Sb2]|nr:hypothetical protein P692DRAFT_20863917 [Suillus brevipes Sb2]